MVRQQWQELQSAAEDAEMQQQKETETNDGRKDLVAGAGEGTHLSTFANDDDDYD